MPPRVCMLMYVAFPQTYTYQHISGRVALPPDWWTSSLRKILNYTLTYFPCLLPLQIFHFPLSLLYNSDFKFYYYLLLRGAVCVMAPVCRGQKANNFVDFALASHLYVDSRD